MPRKTHRHHVFAVQVVQASMRPRPDAAENMQADELRLVQQAAGFNEAAARCRGKRSLLRRRRP